MPAREEVFDPACSVGIRRVLTFESCDVFEKHLWEIVLDELREEYVDFVEVEMSSGGSTPRYDVTYAGDIDALVVALNALAVSAPDEEFHQIANHLLNHLEDALDDRGVFD